MNTEKSPLLPSVDAPSLDRQPERSRTLLILGASGDLTGRLLLPGLASYLISPQAQDLTLVGAGGPQFDQQQWTERVEEAFSASAEKAREKGNGSGADRLSSTLASTAYTALDVTAPGVLSEFIAGLPGPVAVYFALPPAVSQKACQQLAEDGLPEHTRLVLEKPFGTSRASAHELNALLARLAPERDVFRVDHFLGKGTVFNILGLRFANRILEPVWSNLHIDKVEIFFDEDLALENRAGYYDNAGALRDMIQSHLLLILSLVTLNAPASLNERDLRDHMGSVLRAMSINPATTRRARYTAGQIGERSIPDYTAEEGVDASKQTETLAEVTVSINNMRWGGVPFLLRSGKALGAKRKEAVITFKPVSYIPHGFEGVDEPTQLKIGFGPERLELGIDVNGPGDMFVLDRAVLTTDMHPSVQLPYGEILEGILNGDPLLSVRDDIAEDCWRIVEPVLQAWESGQIPLEEYAAGSAGPAGWPSNQDRREPKDETTVDGAPTPAPEPEPKQATAPAETVPGAESSSEGGK